MRSSATKFDRDQPNEDFICKYFKSNAASRRMSTDGATVPALIDAVIRSFSSQVFLDLPKIDGASDQAIESAVVSAGVDDIEPALG